jgi:hypothetical protein
VSAFWLIVTASYSPRELAKLRWLAFQMDKPRDPREAL